MSQRLATSGARDYYAKAGIDIDALMDMHLADPMHVGPDFPRGLLRDVNADLFPRDEYDLGDLGRAR